MSGITAGNIDRVAENLSKTEMETQAQVAARKMYRSLATSSPGGITKEDYLKKVEEVGENRQEVRILQGAGMWQGITINNIFYTTYLCTSRNRFHFFSQNISYSKVFYVFCH